MKEIEVEDWIVLLVRVWWRSVERRTVIAVRDVEWW
jgi:hypothetical protein